MRILLVSEYFPPVVHGGGEVSAQLLAEALDKAGYEVHILTSLPGASDFPSGHIVVHRTLRTGNPLSLSGSVRRMVLLPWQIRREVTRLHELYRFDVVHYLNVVSVLGAPLLPVKQFATVNSYQPLCPKGNLFYKEREPCTGCSPVKFVGCMASSEYVGKMRVSPVLRANPLFLGVLYGQYLRFRRALRRVRPVAVSVFVSDALSRVGFANCPVIPSLPPPPKGKATARNMVLYEGSLEKMKGVHLLLDAYSRLPQLLRQKAPLVVVGDGPLRVTLEHAAPSEVTFTGRVSPNQARDVLAESSIVVAPSQWPEPLSRVLLEAVSLGKVVVATPCGGNVDLVTEESGMLCSANPQHLCEALTALIQNPELRHRLGNAAKTQFKRKFAPERTLAKLNTLYLG